MGDDWRWFVLEVNPEPWAIGPLSVGRKGSRVFPQVGRNMQLHFYKEAIREELGSDHEMIEGKVELRFYFWRRRDEYKTPQARTHRKHEADVTNLQKSTEDALQGILFKNDKDVNDIRSVMVDQGPNVKGRVVIAVRTGSDMPFVRPEFPDDVLQLLNEIDQNDNEWRG